MSIHTLFKNEYIYIRYLTRQTQKMERKNEKKNVDILQRKEINGMNFVFTTHPSNRWPMLLFDRQEL